MLNNSPLIVGEAVLVVYLELCSFGCCEMIIGLQQPSVLHIELGAQKSALACLSKIQCTLKHVECAVPPSTDIEY